MARKPIIPKYYAHYDKETGKIYSVSNEKSDYNIHSVEIPFEEFEEFLTRAKDFNDYIVGYARSADGKTALVPMQVSEQLYGFRNNVFEWITDAPTKNTELTVTWDKLSKQWEFKLSAQCKKRMRDSQVGSTVFFVTLADDFDFLIRSIVIEIKKLVTESNIVIPFESAIESQLDKISISSKIVFQSYGLKTNE